MYPVQFPDTQETLGPLLCGAQSSTGFAQPDGFPIFKGFHPRQMASQSLWALPRRCHTQSQWGSSHPSRWLPQATDSERHNLTIVPFQIGFLCPQKTKNHPSTAQRLLYRGVAHLVCTSIIGRAHPFWRALFTLLYICLK